MPSWYGPLQLARFPQDHAGDLRHEESIRGPLSNQDCWGHQENHLLDYFWATPGRRRIFSPCILLCHTACWESSATLQDDGQAVIIWKLLLVLKDREKRERMGRRAVGGFAMETVLERKHFFHSRYHFLFHQLSDLCRNGLICFETCLTTRPCQNPIL